MNDNLCFLNGEYLPLSQAKVSVLDRAFIFGDGIYEVTPVYGRRLFRFDEHMARMERGLAKIRIQNPATREQWLERCRRLVAALHERTGAAGRALEHLRASHAIERALLSEASDRQLKSLSIRYQLSAAQREAELLRAKQQELATANARLGALNLELAAADAQKSRLLVELERETREDSLTGLANRRRLDERLTEEFERATRYGRPLTVAIADLDHFKDVNDRYTHVAGDEVLKAVGRVLAASVRHTDLVARYGGEEFVLLLVETGADAAQAACEKVRLALERHDWASLRHGLAITVSVGWCADTGLADGQSMLAAADAALYRAKAAGRNRVMAA